MKSPKPPKIKIRTYRRMPPRYIDLHIHSTYSDGEFSVYRIIDTCICKGLKAIAITDHDAIDAYSDGIEYAQEKELEFIPGVEISSYWDNSEIHILGYLFDPTNLALNIKLNDLQQKRVIRAKKIVAKLNDDGIEIDFNRVAKKAAGASIGRPHIATVMLEEEYVSTFQEAFEKYLAGEFIREFETDKLSPFEAIELIQSAGGTSVLAHPDKTQRDDLIPSFVEAGMRGIETFCHGMDRKSVKKYRELAKKFDLVCCGGSDFHNDRFGSRHGLGSVKVPYSSLNAMRRSKYHTLQQQ